MEKSHIVTVLLRETIDKTVQTLQANTNEIGILNVPEFKAQMDSWLESKKPDIDGLVEEVTSEKVRELSNDLFELVKHNAQLKDRMEDLHRSIKIMEKLLR